MGAARQAVAAGLTGLGIDRFPPVASPADQVVPLTGEFHQLVTERQIAKTQQIGDGHRIGTGQAGATLLAELVTQSFSALLIQALDGLAFLGLQGTIVLAERVGQLQVCGVLCSHGERADACGQQIAIGKLQGCLLYTSPSPRD